MRKEIIYKEIQQFKEALKSLYNTVTGIPDITLVVVNKRINQRFFTEGRNGSLDNPPPGSIIDSDFVEHN